jgi:hypothetical protein
MLQRGVSDAVRLVPEQMIQGLARRSSWRVACAAS